MSLFYAQAASRRLKESLQLSVAGAALSENLDSNGMPILKCAVSGETQFVKITTVDNAGRIDGIGQPQESYAPHKATLLRSAAGAAVSEEARARVLAACSKLGMKLEVFESAAQPTDYATDILSATKLLEIRSDEQHPLTKSQ
jgi:hypothetical protein